VINEAKSFVHFIGAWSGVGRLIAFPSKEREMDSEILSSETPAALLERAADCLEIAQAQRDAADTQHRAADEQHNNADKLDELAHSLEASAVQIQGNAQLMLPVDVGKSRQRSARTGDDRAIRFNT
jgi:hypothetical protein